MVYKWSLGALVKNKSTGLRGKIIAQLYPTVSNAGNDQRFLVQYIIPPVDDLHRASEANLWDKGEDLESLL